MEKREGEPPADHRFPLRRKRRKLGAAVGPSVRRNAERRKGGGRKGDKTIGACKLARAARAAKGVFKRTVNGEGRRRRVSIGDELKQQRRSAA